MFLRFFRVYFSDLLLLPLCLLFFAFVAFLFLVLGVALLLFPLLFCFCCLCCIYYLFFLVRSGREAPRNLPQSRGCGLMLRCQIGRTLAHLLGHPHAFAYTHTHLYALVPHSPFHSYRCQLNLFEFPRLAEPISHSRLQLDRKHLRKK